MSIFASSLLVNDALGRIDRLYGSKQIWTSNNNLQRLILRHKSDCLAIAKTLNSRELFGESAHFVGPVNDFLRKNGFGEIQLEDLGFGPDMAYVASIMRLMGQWLSWGLKGYQLPGSQKPAFRLFPHSGLAHFVWHGQRLVRIQTNADFDMWLSEEVQPAQNFAMIDDWIHTIAGAVAIKGNGAVLPFVKIDMAKIDIRDLIGMSSRDTVIQQVLAAAKFKLTNNEVSFEMAVAVGAKRLSIEIQRPERDDFVVKDFLNFALVRRQRPLMPLAVGRVPASEFSATSDIE